ncbi:hypothetical protein ASZ90_016922 [hydrocarbon metagenome]|uniref:Uncharacterized protein n=1 Tax=hydrocarbon metagenome TaxID=938273 RepID=A0A0W8EAH6_9ZZZZ
MVASQAGSRDTCPSVRPSWRGQQCRIQPGIARKGAMVR